MLAENLFDGHIQTKLLRICTRVIIPPPLSVMGEVYCFLRRQLIFSFVRRVIQNLKVL